MCIFCFCFFFCFVCFFVCIFVCLFFLFLFYWGGMGDNIPTALYKIYGTQEVEILLNRFFAPCKSWSLDSTLRIPDSRFQVLEFPDSFGVYSGFQSPRFWIPQAKIFRIPEPDSLIYVELDFALTVCKRPDFHGAVF